MNNRLFIGEWLNGESSSLISYRIYFQVGSTPTSPTNFCFTTKGDAENVSTEVMLCPSK